MVLPLSEPIRGLDGTLMSEIPVPKGTVIHVGVLGSNMNRRTWGDDAWEWKPERWLAPLPADDMLREANATGRVLIVDETRETGGVGEGVLATLLSHGYTGAVDRVAGKDSFIPLGDAALHVLLSEDTIEAAARKLAEGDA